MFCASKMSKALMAGVVAAAIALVGCAAGGSEGEGKGDTTSESSPNANIPDAPSAVEDATNEEIEEGAPVGMPNPWSEAATADEAAKGAGLATSFSVPDQIQRGEQTFSNPTFLYMDGIAEAIYDQGASRIVIRKGTILGTALSGDYTNYEKTWDITPGGLLVTCHGHEDGQVIAADWSNGEHDEDKFYLLAQGLGGEDIPMTEDEVSLLATSEIR